ncbi:site-specific integrase [Azotobacter vinelandii]|uniref:site-specific integrase n=1 Tax=Azotobacter vinelandii TaxID=354 RepID=UPI00091764A8|nr:site-specific integrase [Azotobacter vinelandii]WKN23083.1 site-specific integrase [Azotobacter vinelandii]SFX84149.1 Site-specific recombinase XerD [Azotobacter vinelandii]
MTPQELAQAYIDDHELRPASKTIYRAATKALTRHFGTTIDVQAIDRRSILSWRSKVLAKGLAKRSWNTYSTHLRTLWGYAIEYGLLPQQPNPFKKTAVRPPKRASKTVASEAIHRARRWLDSLVDEERCTGRRSKITPAWFWLATFEMFYYTGIRLNALLCLRVQDVDWDRQLLLIRGDTEKTHREYQVPIVEGLAPHIRKLLDQAKRAGFVPTDQLFNVNRFSRHYRRSEMNTDQVEAMYRKLIEKIGVRMTPHRFRHTLASDLMRQPERNIHLTKSLLNHSNIATTMGYIEVDYDHMREVLHERSLQQGVSPLVRCEDASGAPPRGEAKVPEASAGQSTPRLLEQRIVLQVEGVGGAPCELTLRLLAAPAGEMAPTPPAELFEPSAIFTLMSNRPGTRTLGKAVPGRGQTSRLTAKASP